MQMRRIGTALALLAMLLSACGHASPGGEGTLRAQGDVRLSRLGGPAVAVTRSRRLNTGDLVTVGAGTAKVALPNGGHLEMRPGSSVRFHSGPAIQTGDLLVESASSPVHVDGGIGDVSVEGTVRLRRDLALDVGTYAGTATLRSGRTLVVPWLREVAVPSVGVAPDPIPLRISEADGWDVRFLGPALDLTRELDDRSRYVDANSGPGSDHAVFYRRAFQPLATSASFDDTLLRSASPAGAPHPGEAFVATAIALSGPGPFADRWRAAFALRAAGAQWGIVALDQHASPNALVSLLNSAVTASAVAPTVAALAEGTGAPTAIPPAATDTHPVPVVPGLVTTTTTRPRTTQPTKPKPPGSTTTTTLLPAPLPTVPPAQAPPPPLAPLIDPVVGIARTLGVAP
ncbi:MAG: hypothetical protein NVSMB12_07740 [Acidimicrobiales bacterium]